MSQVSVYFDTDKQKLRKHGLLLRVRRSGDHYQQTIKATEDSNVLSRDEWESEIADEHPDLSLAHGTKLGPLVNGKLRRRLRPMFETRIRRTVYPLAHEGCAIALTLDRGTIKAGDSSMPLCEIELELERGDEAALFDVARQITHALPAQIGLRSKAERGYRLIDGEDGVAAKFGGVSLIAGMPARDAFRRIGRACPRQVTGNEAALHKGDAEAAHQMRVGLRRLRAAISLFASLLDDPQTETIKDELKWLTARLAPARELEVLIERVVKPVTQRKSRWAGVPSLSRQFADRRVAALARAQDAIESERFRLLMLEVAAWLEIGQWTKPQDDLVCARGDLPIETFAAEQLARRSRKVRKRRKSFARLDARRRHKLRIQAKKLRYAADFFADLFPGRRAVKRREKFLAALERVHDSLGDLNDITVHESLISATGTRRRRGSRNKAFAAGVLTGREDARVDAATAAAANALAHFAEAKPFW
jgi:triphosphatase